MGEHKDRPASRWDGSEMPLGINADIETGETVD